jgi:hypothetical protein
LNPTTLHPKADTIFFRDAIREGQKLIKPPKELRKPKEKKINTLVLKDGTDEIIQYS